MLSFTPARGRCCLFPAAVKNGSNFVVGRFSCLFSTTPVAFQKQPQQSPPPIKSVTVIGSGLMGSAIAQVSAQANLRVQLVDQNPAILDNALKRIQANLTRVAKKKFEGVDNLEKQTEFVKQSLDKITLMTDTEKAVASADLVIEAIIENVKAKQELFDLVENATKPETILTTNTSSLRLADIGARLRRKERFGGLHFFNPVPVMKLLEVVRTDQTSDETFGALMAYGKAIGKVTVACKDTPGFIVNRLLVPYLLEAVRLYERGHASKEDIDMAMKLGAGHPMGPFQLLDYVGLDTTKFIMDGWHEKHPDEPLFRPSQTVDQLVAGNKLGMKTGEGFFKYDDGGKN